MVKETAALIPMVLQSGGNPEDWCLVTALAIKTKFFSQPALLMRFLNAIKKQLSL